MAIAKTDEMKAALWTSGFTFTGLFLASLAGWVQQVIDWSNAGGGAQVFPHVSVLGRAAVSAAGSAFVGFLNFAYRWAQAKGWPLPGAKPNYQPGELNHP